MCCLIIQLLVHFALQENEFGQRLSGDKSSGRRHPTFKLSSLYKVDIKLCVPKKRRPGTECCVLTVKNARLGINSLKYDDGTELTMDQLTHRGTGPRTASNRLGLLASTLQMFPFGGYRALGSATPSRKRSGVWILGRTCTSSRTAEH